MELTEQMLPTLFGYPLGNRLAEMQLTVVWEEILKRFKKVEVLDKSVRANSNLVKGYTKLPVRVHPIKH